MTTSIIGSQKKISHLSLKGAKEITFPQTRQTDRRIFGIILKQNIIVDFDMSLLFVCIALSPLLLDNIFYFGLDN